MTPSQYAQTVVSTGTGCLVIDPHEIANVRGIDCIRFMIEDSLRSPLRVYAMIPSCVPLTRPETSRAALGLREIEELRGFNRVTWLGGRW